MKKVLILTTAILGFIMTSCISHGHVCNTYTDNTTPSIENTNQDS